jgi:hypothetical protein
MNWDECKIKGFVKEVKIDRELINSLLKQSKKKIITDKFSPLNEDTISTKFCNNYDALREILEAIALQKGFKIYNHECFTGFIKKILNLDSESFSFDKFRRIRNSINYYGQDLSIEDGRRLIDEVNALREEIVKLLGND